jgi:hypothetical protein
MNRTIRRPAIDRPIHSSISLSGMLVMLLLTAMPMLGQYEALQQKPAGREPALHPAFPAILAAFDTYEVVGMSAAHGLQDTDDFILALIRTPAFLDKVDDIVVECGNSLYQPILDRYIAGEDVPFSEVRKVWRNTTQLMCSTSGFFEQFFPLVRGINQKLAPGKRIRVLAGDPPVDWDNLKTQGLGDLKYGRDRNIASVMEKEVLSKHRKALMLFGYFHLMHANVFDEISAVSIYEKDYPNSTFVIAGLECLDLQTPLLSTSPYAGWPAPSLMLAKGTWLGAIRLSHFTPPPYLMKDCVATAGFPEGEDRRMEEVVDAFLYLGPPSLALREQMPADIALDSSYMAELRHRANLLGEAAMLPSDAQIVSAAEQAIPGVPKGSGQ